jgi:hypothetical protein
MQKYIALLNTYVAVGGAWFFSSSFFCLGKFAARSLRNCCFENICPQNRHQAFDFNFPPRSIQTFQQPAFFTQPFQVIRIKSSLYLCPAMPVFLQQINKVREQHVYKLRIGQH